MVAFGLLSRKIATPSFSDRVGLRSSQGLSTDVLALLGVIALVWAATWMICAMLRPLVNLEAGVEAVEAGNLDVRIPEKGRDEF